MLIKSQIQYAVLLGDGKGWTGTVSRSASHPKEKNVSSTMTHDDTNSKNPLSSSFVFCEMLMVQKPHSSIAQSKYETECMKNAPFYTPIDFDL